MYGKIKGKIKLSSPKNPINPYGSAKVESFNITKMFRLENNIKYGYYLNIHNRSYINLTKTIYFIMNYFIQLSCMFLGWNTVNEFYLKPVKVKSKDRPHR